MPDKTTTDHLRTRVMNIAAEHGLTLYALGEIIRTTGRRPENEPDETPQLADIRPRARPIEEWDPERTVGIWVSGPDEEFAFYAGGPDWPDWPVDPDGKPLFKWWVPFPNYQFPARDIGLVDAVIFDREVNARELKAAKAAEQQIYESLAANATALKADRERLLASGVEPGDLVPILDAVSTKAQAAIGALETIPRDATLLWRFYWDCKRMGELRGLMLATAAEIEGLIGLEVRFGEVLGKHSDIYGTLERQDFTLRKLPEDDLAVFRRYPNLLASGHDPRDYFTCANCKDPVKPRQKLCPACAADPKVTRGFDVLPTAAPPLPEGYEAWACSSCGAVVNLLISDVSQVPFCIQPTNEQQGGCGHRMERMNPPEFPDS